MIEGSAKNLEQQIIQHAIKKGVKASQTIISSINQLCEKYGKPKREIVHEINNDEEISNEIKAEIKKYIC